MTKADSSKPKTATEAINTESLTPAQLHSLEDRAHLFDLIMEAPCYVTFFTGYDGQGAASS